MRGPARWLSHVGLTMLLVTAATLVLVPRLAPWPSLR